MVAMAVSAIASSMLVGASAALPDLLPPELRWLPTVLAFCAGGLASLALASLDHAASDDEELVVVAAPPPVDAKVSPLPARKISAKRTWDASPPTRFPDALCRAGDDRTERALWAVGVLDALARDDAKGWRAVLTQPSLVVSQRRSDYAGGPTAWRLRMRGVRAAPEAVARLLQDEARQTTWNPTLVGYDVLAEEEAGFPDAFGRPTRVTKTTAAAECGGLVSSRDFTNLLRTERRGDRFLVGGTGLVDDAYPPVAGAVRGFNGPSGWVVEPGAGGADVTWIIGSDLRGWLSRALIDAAISTVMVKFARALNDRVGKDVVK